MPRSSDLLFHKYELGAVIEGQAKAVADAVNAVPDRELLNSPTEVFVERFAREFQLELPVLLEDERHVSHEEAEVEIYDPWDRCHMRARGYRVTLVVPFQGDHELFFCHPFTFTLNPPRALIGPGTLSLTRELREIDAPQLKASFDTELTTIKQWLGWVNDGVKRFNEGLPGHVQQRVDARRQELRRAQDAVAALGLPVRNSHEAPRTYAAPEVSRKPAPPMPQAGRTQPLEPALAQQHYEHILQVVQSFAIVMERSPRAFAGMGEEHIRDNLLAHLNGHYPGLATGETFNVSGKTDILVRSQDQNIFIAECKFWEGPAAFSDAIDQLRGYLGWRDRKTALFMFNRRKSFSSVLGKIHSGVLAHPAFKKEVSSPLGEGTFRFVLRQVNDEDADMLMSVLAFDVPTA